MALHTLHGDSAPTLTQPGDTGAVNLSLAFYIDTDTGRTADKVRFYVPAGTTDLPASGHLGYIFASTGSPPAPSGAALAGCTFTGVAPGQWNEATLDTPVDLTPGAIYWAVVYFPAGRYGLEDNKFIAGDVQAADGSSLKARQSALVSPGNGSFLYGAAGTPPTTGSGGDWYGIDVVINDHIAGESDGDLNDHIAITDEITWLREGLPTEVVATATATDPLTLSDTDEATISLGGDTGVRTVHASLLENRITWGSAIDTSIQGPSFSVEAAGAITLALQAKLQRACKVRVSRIYKAPTAAGTVTITMWTAAGVELASTTVTWVSDLGGWREIDFPLVDVAAAGEIVVGYNVPNGRYALSQWVWNGQATVMYPFEIADFQTSGATNGLYRLGTPGFPASKTAHNYYIDLEAEWTDTMPGYEGGTDYYDQWVNGGSSFDFLVGVYYADPEFHEDYVSVGVNTNVAMPAQPAYVEAAVAAGMDVYADAQTGSLSGLYAAVENPDFAARLKGYFMCDEPDLFSPDGYFRSPQLIRSWINLLRAADSTRPCILNLGKVPPYAQGFFYKPEGATIQQAAQYWRDWAALSDVNSCDFYAMTSDTAEGRFGIWIYPSLVRKMMDISDRRTPVWGYVETTSQVPNEPAPAQVTRATWASLIAGATGIVFFDHRFANASVTQDFAALLHDEDMRAEVTALAARLQMLAPSLYAPDADLVTAYESTGTLATNVGGIATGAEIPMHYSTRVTDDAEYLFAMPIRPGETTATFTIPSWAGETVAVIGESRTVDVDGAGLLEDDFDDGDYTVHLYEKT